MIFVRQTVCNAEAKVIGIEFDGRSEIHIGDDDEEDGDEIKLGVERFEDGFV